MFSILSSEDYDLLSELADKSLPVQLFLWSGVKRITPLDFSKYVPVFMTGHFHKFQARWFMKSLRDWWCCQLVATWYPQSSW